MIVPLIRNLLLGWARQKIKKNFEQQQTLFKTNLSRANFSQSINTLYPKFVLRPSNNLKISILFYCHLLRQYLQFLSPEALKKPLQSSLHTHKKTFCKNHNMSPPEPTKNLAKQTEKPIKTHCKPAKNTLTQETIKKDNENDFANLRCLTVFSFFSNKMIRKHIAMLN